MLLRIFASFFILFAASAGFSQINIQWESRLDGDGSFIDKAVDLELDALGNTYVTGSSYDGASYELVTVKYDSDGTELWRATYGGAGIDEAYGLTLDSNDDVIITGTRFMGGTDWDIVTIKYDGVTGVELWSVINGGSGFYDAGLDIAVDASDNVIVAGSRGSAGEDVDFIVLKYNSAGGFIWAQLLGGVGNDLVKSVKVDATGNIYVAGHRQLVLEESDYDFYVAKYNPAGVLQWAVTEDSGYGQLDTPFAMELDGSNNVIVAGSGFYDVFNKEEYMTVKFSNATGAVLWKNLYGGDAGDRDVVNAIAVDGSDNVYITGRSKSMDSSEDYYTIAYNSSGTELWADRYSTEGLGFDEGTDIKVSDSDLHVYVTGYSFYTETNNDFTTIKYDVTDGSILWTTIFDGPSSNSDQALRMQLDPIDNLFITGNSHGGVTNLDYSTIKYCQLTTTASPDTSVCDGGSVDLVASGGMNVTWGVLSGDALSMSCTECETMTATPSETTVYIVSSESLSGCVDYDTVLVEVHPIPTVSIYNDTPLDFCEGSSVTLYTDSYDSYDWSTGSTDSFTVVTGEGTIMLTIIDTNACTNSTSVVVSTYGLPVISVGPDLSICPGETVELLATGGISYVWDTDPTLSSLLIPDPNASPAVDTEYKVTGTDDNGCTNRDSLFVNVYDLPSVNAGPDETVCIGDSVHLMATGATSYVWDVEPTLSSLVIADPWASPIVLTKYFVTGTDDNGCANRDSVNVSTLAVPDIYAGIDTVVCAGGSVQLFASGGLPDSYVWNDDPTLSETSVYNPFASPLTGTNYVVKGTDINGCSNTDTVFVAVYDLPSVDAGDDDAICIGDSIQLNASGGTVYTWDSDPTLSALGVSDPWANPITDKIYTVTAEDDNGCVNSDDVVITVNPLPAIDAGTDVSICQGDSTQLEATGGVLYVWDFNPTLSNFVIGDPWASPTSTTTYYVEGTDAEGCSNTDEVTVTVNPLPTPPVLTKDSVFIISSIVLGNQWYHETGELVGETDDTLNYYDTGLNGEYWVVYTDDNGCSVESDRIDNQIIITDVSIEEHTATLDVKLYPNPTHSIVNIEFDEELDQVVLYTMDGKVITANQSLAPGINQLSFESLPRGTYLLQIVKGDQVSVQKIIKQ